jgi:hypothetical protein
MSRRQRRRAAATGGTVRSRLWARALVATLILGVVAMGGSYLWLRAWLHGESFRRMLAGQTDKALDVSSEYGAFRWSGTRMDTSSFVASGDALVKSIDAEGLLVEVGLGGWWKGVWQIDDARARRIEVVIDATAADRVKSAATPAGSPAAPAQKQKKWYDSLIPHEVELKQVDLASSAVKVITRSGPVGIAGTSWHLTPDAASEGSYRAEGNGGTVKLPWKRAPRMNLGRARLLYRGETIYLTGADFQVYESGRLDLSGEMSVKGDGYTFTGDLRDVYCAEILPEDWKQRLSGKVDAGFTVEGGKAGPAVTGKLALTNGVLTAMPLLDSLSAYADTTRFRRLALEEGKTDFSWEEETLVLRNLVLASEGLMRLEGSLRMDPQEQLDGRFRLGIVPGVLARIPGAESVVFRPGERGLLWTDLRITGTRDDPQEDLSRRLIEAAGLRMFEVLPETGERVLKFTQDVIGEDLEGHLLKGAAVLDQGRAVMDEAKDVVDEVGGIFDVLRGKEDRKPDEESR